MHVLGDLRRVPGYWFSALVLVDGKMRRLERGPGE